MIYLQYKYRTKKRFNINFMEKKEDINFKNYWEALSAEKKVQLRDEFMGRSGIPYTTFYYRLNKMSFMRLEQRLLNELCGIDFKWS